LQRRERCPRAGGYEGKIQLGTSAIDPRIKASWQHSGRKKNARANAFKGTFKPSTNDSCERNWEEKRAKERLAKAEGSEK